MMFKNKFSDASNLIPLLKNVGAHRKHAASLFQFIIRRHNLFIKEYDALAIYYFERYFPSEFMKKKDLK